MTMISMLLLFAFVEFDLAASCAYGEGCRFPCRCQTGGCDPVTGDCYIGRCIDVPPTEHGYGWKGAGCRIGNIAYDKHTSQSGVWNGFKSDRAADGNTDPNLESGGSCAHPAAPGDNPAWWMVDLGKKHAITEMVIYNRDAAQYRTNDFDIRIGMTAVISDQDQCVSYNSGGVDVLNLTCTEDVTEGRYVSMRRHANSRDHIYMNICEFVVLGYEPIECNDKCIGSCNDLNGCDTCAAGYKRPDCIDACDQNRWGPNCASLCGVQCIGTCDVLTGCNSCASGFKLPECVDECDQGTWGPNCMNQCRDRCTGTCDAHTGCDICSAGYKPPDCENLCDSETWGVDCMKQCGNCAVNKQCDPRNGECSNGCEQWWLNTTCNVKIEKPDLQASTIQITFYSSSIMSVTWQYDQNIPEQLPSYYFYRVEYGPIGETKILSQKVLHDANRDSEYVSFNLTDLNFNTEYEVIVLPYRKQNGNEEIGVKSATAIDTTPCTEPSKLFINVTAHSGGWIVHFTKLRNLEPGCNTLSSYTLYVSHSDIMVYNVSIWNDSPFNLPFSRKYVEAELWIVAVNNQHLSTKSPKEILYLHQQSSMDSATIIQPLTDDQINETAEGATVLILSCVLGLLCGTALIAGIIFAVRKSKHCVRQNSNTQDTHNNEHNQLHINRTAKQNESDPAYENVLGIKDIESMDQTSDKNTEYEENQTRANVYETLDTGGLTVDASPTVYQTIQ